MRETADTLRNFKRKVKAIERKAAGKTLIENPLMQKLEKKFTGNMDDDLNAKKAFDGICNVVSEIKTDDLKPAEAAGVITMLKRIDEVFKVIF
jgi:cysteinyl-tRNA synthetase